MINIFGYISFGISVASAVPAIIALVKAPGAVSGTQLNSIVYPSVLGLESLLGNKVDIPDEIVADICNSAADSINRYYKNINPAPNTLSQFADFQAKAAQANLSSGQVGAAQGLKGL